MKIGLVCPYSITKHGGVLEVVLALQSGLVKKGHDVRVITPAPRGSETQEIENVIFIGTSTDFRSPSHTTTQVSSASDNESVDAILAEEDFDILHFHEPWVPLLSRQLLQRSQSVNIATFHSKVPEAIMTRTLAKAVNPYLRSVMKYLDVLTAVSNSGAEYALNMTEKPIALIPNGIDLAKYQHPAHKKKDDTKTILFVGRLEKRKGVKYLLQAYALLAQNNQNIQLQIAGDGPDREKLELMAEDLKLPNVSFLGYVSEEMKLDLLEDADVFCSPALYGESFGIVLLEAMATGTVCVAGNNSGYSDLMQGTGALSIVNPQDSTEFARRLETMLNDDDVRKLWKTWAADYVKEFSYPKVVDQYIDLYEDALEQHAK